MIKLKCFSMRSFLPLTILGLLGCASSGTNNAGVMNYSTRLTEPRLEPIAIEDATQEQILTLAVDPEAAAGRVNLNLFRTMLNNPEFMGNWRYFGDYVNSTPSISNRDRELLIMRLGWLYYAEYEWAIHYNQAINNGLSPAQIEAVKVGAEHESWDSFDRAWLRAADSLVKEAFISDTDWAVLTQRYSETDLIVMLGIAAHYHLVAMITNTLGVPVDSNLTNRF